jgi:D-alanyl-D-alanine carboxypeptidase (penicillin-binding protein 5/6)
LRILAVLLVLAAIAYVIVFGLVRSLPGAAVAAVPRAKVFPGRPSALAWPAQGQAAVAIEGVGRLGARGLQTPTPTASLAKVMTAYVVLHDHPLAPGASGPRIRVSARDAATYRADRATGQSVAAVRAGERLSERQALEALLLPSGNNIAALLANWDAGSQAAFLAKMNAQARALGLAHTRYVDASGLSPGTVSTASDQVRLGLAALRMLAFRRIVAMPQVTLPVAGRQYNVNALLGRHGIVGVKTGSTSRAGGCFLFAAHTLVRGYRATVVGAVLHQLATRRQPSIIEQAFHTSAALLGSVTKALTRFAVIHRGQTLATVRVPWASPAALQASRSIALLGWPGLPINTRIVRAPRLALPLRAGQAVAAAVVTVGDQHARVPLIAAQPLPQASFGWRLSHP